MRYLTDLETEFWSKAQYISIFDDEVSEIFRSLKALRVPLVNRWHTEDKEPDSIGKRMIHCEKTIPSVHPAFLKDDAEPIRRVQWCIQKSAEYRQLTERYWLRFIDYIKANYDLSAGLVDISLRLFEKDIERWIAEREYMGLEYNREEMAEDQIVLWRHVRRIAKAKGEPEDKKSNQEIWNQAVIEWLRELYGREITEQELEFEYQMWRDLLEDMKAEKPASESEAATYLRDLIERYPRKG